MKAVIEITSEVKLFVPLASRGLRHDFVCFSSTESWAKMVCLMREFALLQLCALKLVSGFPNTTDG